MRILYQYIVEMYINNEWILETRYYYHIKDLNEFDLRDVENKRRNAKFIK